MEKTSIKTNTTTKDKAGFTSAELEEKFLKIAKHTTKDSIRFTRIFNDQVKIFGYTRKAVMETISICKNRNLLKEYLESREKEVVDIMSFLFDDEYIMRLYVEDKVQEAREEAEKELKEAAKEAAKKAAKEAAEEAEKEATKKAVEEAKRKNIEVAQRLFSLGMEVQKISEVIDVEPSQVEEWIREVQNEKH